MEEEYYKDYYFLRSHGIYLCHSTLGKPIGARDL